ncbi:hypothetical protein CPB86DRAFT_248610 [Serendipita vermifera]|nr:hypothetical protein CPB86DRAFT_248610 [Serendipita vermifera]
MASDLLGLFTTFTRNQYFQVAFHTVIIHETIITIDQSVELFWMRPWSPSKVLFLVNRYAGALTVSLYTLQQFVKDPSTTVLAILLRIIALWNRSRLVKGVATLLSLANILAFVITNSYGWAIVSVKSQMWPFIGCSATPQGDLKINLLLIPGFTFETSALIFTLLRVYPMVKQAGERLPILNLLLSDGIAY